MSFVMKNINPVTKLEEAVFRYMVYAGQAFEQPFEAARIPVPFRSIMQGEDFRRLLQLLWHQQ